MNNFKQDINTLKDHDFHALQHETSEGESVESFGELCQRISRSFNSSIKALEFLTYAEKSFQDEISWMEEHIGDETQYRDQIYKLKVIRETMDFFEKLQAFDKTPHQLSKVKLNLSVEELACLIRLLHEEGIIDQQANSTKTILMDSICQLFSAKKQESISAKSLKNKYDSPTPNASRNIDIILRNLISRINNSEIF